MTRVLVTGGTGFIGQAVCPALRAAGYQVSVATRNPRIAEPMHGFEVRPIAGVRAGTDWSAAMRDVDTVVHLAARVHMINDPAADPLTEFRRVNTEGPRRLADYAAAMGVRRLVFLSTVKVLGEATPSGTAFTENDPPAPVDDYARSKWEAEQALAAVAARGRLQVVVLRPPLVYGPNVKGNMLALLERCRKGPVLPLAAVNNQRSLMYVANLADIIVRCVGVEAAAGRSYLVRDGDDVSTPMLIRTLSRAMGRPARLYPVPTFLLRAAGRAAGRQAAVDRLTQSLCVDDSRVRRELDWTPPFSVVQGLEATAAWFTKRGTAR